MNDVINYFIKSLAASTASLKKKSILIDKPWALIDDDGEVQKLIFKRNHGLILSKNGVVIEGSWEYYPEAKALLINRVKDKLLLKEQFIDNNVLILKKDGTNNEFFTLANENTITDYDVPKYLNSLKCTRLKIQEVSLLNGKLIQIHGGIDVGVLRSYAGLPVELIDNRFNTYEPTDSSYLSKDKEYTLYINNGKIIDVKKNIIKEFKNGQTIEIEDGCEISIYKNINKRISINGLPVKDTQLIDNENFMYKIKESKILKILFVKDYVLKNGDKIRVEQQNVDKISKGDKIIPIRPLVYLPDGSHKIKGRLFKIKVKNGIIA